VGRGELKPFANRHLQQQAPTTGSATTFARSSVAVESAAEPSCTAAGSSPRWDSGRLGAPSVPWWKGMFTAWRPVQSSWPLAVWPGAIFLLDRGGENRMCRPERLLTWQIRGSGADRP